MGTIDKNCYSLIKFGTYIGSDYYPESMGLFFVVNAPMIFPFFWSIVKGWLDEKTRNRIKVLGANYKEELLEMIAPDQLPKFLGGDCECPGECMFSNKGPWNDFEPL